MTNEYEELKQVICLMQIERKVEREALTRAEVELVQRLANVNHYPRAEYVLARMYLKGNGVEQDKTKALKYLVRSSRHASYDLQLKIAYIYHTIGECEKIKKCLERAIKDVDNCYNEFENNKNSN